MTLTDLHTCNAQWTLIRPFRTHFKAFRAAGVPKNGSKGTTRAHLTECDRQSTAMDVRCSAQEAGSADRMSRRGLLSAIPLVFVASANMASAESLVPYEDTIDNFQVAIPDGWISAQASSGGSRAFGGAPGTRRALAWYPEAGTDTNVTVIITNVGADYTALGSFGNAEQFGENLVASLDRSFMLKSGFNRPKSVQKARLLDAKTKSGMYMLEYTVQKPEEDEPRHFLSAVSLGYNGRYNRLYTLTAQTREADFGGTKSTLQQVLGSFKPPTPVI